MNKHIAYMTTSNHTKYGGGWIRDALLVKTIRDLGRDIFYYSTFFKPFVEDHVKHDCVLFNIRNVLLAHNIPSYHKFPVFRHEGFSFNALSSRVPYIKKFNFEKSALFDLDAITSKVASDLENRIITHLPRESRMKREYEVLDSLLSGMDGKLKREVVKLQNRVIKDDVKLLNVCSVIWSKSTQDIKNTTGLIDIATIQGEDEIISIYPEEYQRNITQRLRENVKHTDCFIAVSKYCANKVGHELRIPPKKIKVVYNGIDLDRYKPLGEKKNKKTFTVMFLGRIDLCKGILTLVFAAKHIIDAGHKNLKVYVAGSVSDQSYLNIVKECISMFGLGDAFEIEPSISTEKKVERLNFADVVVYPVIYPEHFGLVLVESMACGTPVIVPDHGAFPEIIKETGGGLLFKPNDSADLAKKIIMLMEDIDMRKKLSRSGLNNVKMKFSAKHFAEEVLDTYDGLLESSD